MPSISVQKTAANFNLNNKNTSSTFPANYGDPSINMWFPNDLSQGGQNPLFMLFQFFKYQRPSIYSAPTLSGLGNVGFPLPSDLVDRVSLTYDQRGFGSAIGAALDSFSAVGAAKGGISSTMTALAEHAATVGEGVGLGLAGTAINTVGRIPGLAGASNIIPGGLQFLGYAQNPFLSILFNAPQFKRFGMTWTFIPETPQDSATLNFILNKFKYHSLPDIAAGGLFFTYPDIIVPTIYPTGYFFDFKQCVLENVTVNYVPGNTPAVYSGTLAPTAIQFTITLLEIALWYKGDYQNKSDGTSVSAPTQPGVQTTQPSRPVTPTPFNQLPSRPVTPTPGINNTVSPNGNDPLGFSLGTGEGNP